jgi:hypothetical protein
MTTTTATHTASALAPWLRRLRFLLAVAFVWAVLHFIVDQTVLARGLDRPVMLLTSASDLVAGMIVVVLLWVAAAIATALAGGRESARTLAVVGLALALWAVEGGTMDDWLRIKNETVTQSAAPAYRALLADYVLLLIATAGVALIGGIAALGGDVRNAEKRRQTLRQTFALDASGRQWRQGLLALVISAAVAALLMLVLTGPGIAWTRRGQVYFAIVVAFAIGVLVARRLTDARHPLWYWLAPFLVGIVGALFAAWRPSLPGQYSDLNVIPALGLVRPLPVEMVGVGLVACVWTWRTTLSAQADSDEN